MGLITSKISILVLEVPFTPFLNLLGLATVQHKVSIQFYSLPAKYRVRSFNNMLLLISNYAGCFSDVSYGLHELRVIECSAD